MKNFKIAITIGDPSGIGPEIIAKSLSKESVFDSCIPIVIGSEAVMRDGIKIAKSELKVKAISDIKDAKFEPNTINVLDVYPEFDINNLKYGEVQKESGKLAGLSIKKAIELALEKEVDAVVTAPINKESFALAGFPYPGHTEMFADLTNTKDYSMVLMHGNLRVAHVTTHVSMRKAIDLIKTERVLKVIRVANAACKNLGIKEPVIGVAGLNAHAGENGLFGQEEIEEIIPAIKLAKAEGIKVEGPLPADTIFSKAMAGIYDCVVAMYHDQGHIPVKQLGFTLDKLTGLWTEIKGVNISFGMPIIRVSVDHGTAFGKAGKGTANEASLTNAIEVAIILAENKEENNC